MKPCANPTPFETLVSMWSGGLSGGELDALEEHLFGCDECSAASDRLARLVGGLRELVPPVISQAHRERLLAQGARVRVTPVEPDSTARALFSADVDLLVHALRADLSKAERVDVEMLTQEGQQFFVMEHVPFDAAAGEVLIACQRHYATMYPLDPVFRVHAVEAGKRRHVADYLVYHEWA